MKKIKFRGITEDGKHIFSNSIEFEKIGGLSDYQPYLRNDTGDWVRCYPESIAQFVGYDADGKEVYEGDKVHGISGTMIGHTFTARRANVAQSTNGMYWGFLPEDVRKESGKNENLS